MNSFQFFMTQCGATVVMSLLRWLFIWTNTTNDKVSWPIVNNLFYMVALSWLFTLGYFVKSRMDENYKKRIEELESGYRNLDYRKREEAKTLENTIDSLLREKERFFTIVENMVRNVGMKEAEFHLTKNDKEIVEKERALISSFVGG